MKKHHYLKNNHCIVCGKLITDYHSKCRICCRKGIPRTHGKYCKQYYCLKCKTEISSPFAKYCKKCYSNILKNQPEENHPQWKGGKPKCEVCGKEISYGHIYCKKHMLHCKMSKKSKQKISKANKGKKNGMYTHGKYIRNKKCIDCQKKCSPGAIRCKSCSERFNKTGDKNPNWNNGSSKFPYSLDWTNELKESIRKRDQYTCQMCGINENDYYRKLDVHHIDYDKFNCQKNNLITLCNSCHMKTNKNRNYWKERLQIP